VLSGLFKWSVVLALVSSIGLHWAFLQAMAWTGMILTYSQEGTFREALAKTFDGQHPCSLCKQIDVGKKSEKKSDGKIDGKKQLEFVYDQQMLGFSPPTSYCLLRPHDDCTPDLSTPPPLPPPRLI